MKVIPITRAHLSDVARLERLCFDEPWSEASLELLLGEGAVGWACEEDGTVVAYVGMMLALDEGQVTNVAVHPEHRRRGYGAAVVEALIRDARERGLVQIALEVRVSNAAAISLYERFGFTRAGIRRRFYRNPTEDGAVMLLNLQETD